MDAALLRCDYEIESFIEEHGLAEDEGHFTLSRPRRLWRGAAPRLALLATGVGHASALTWLALARPGSAVSNFDRSIRVERLHPVAPPLALHELGAALSQHFRDVVDRDGPLTPAAGHYLVDGVLKLRPQLRAVVADLTGVDAPVPHGAAGELLAWEKDATGTLLDIAGVDRGILRQWRPSGPDVPFLGGLADLRVHENALIDHDAGRFSGWLGEDAHQVGWRVFTNGRARMFVMNVNQTAVEHTLGVDLVYYNERRDSFVLVQYKKLLRDDQGSWQYRPDGQLTSELDRMRTVDRQCEGATPAGEFRLLPTPCLVKLCRADTLIVDRTRVLGGMYLPRAYFEQVLNDGSLVGPRGGVRLDFENVQHHLTNSLFVDLVRDGWIGSTGAGTAYVKEQIQTSLQSGRSVVFGAHSQGA